MEFLAHAEQDEKWYDEGLFSRVALALETEQRACLVMMVAAVVEEEAAAEGAAAASTVGEQAAALWRV